ncbi:cupin domain-containing protein [Pseudomonas sp. RHF3.3-3]|uniref:(R)-mandelonitrile lyase n=1 Tax=Pseudomonas sp. RHF3.3-3 TaxID=3396624 RepID=UPI003A889D88
MLAGEAQADSIQVKPAGSAPSAIGTPAQFTGNVTIDGLTTPGSAAFAGSGLVAFAPGARTVWHSHPAGQWLFITAGSGWVQEIGQPRKRVKAGDAVWIPEGVKHWHGATDQNGMSHIAITPMHEGKNVEWMEEVSQADYLPPAGDV